METLNIPIKHNVELSSILQKIIKISPKSKMKRISFNSDEIISLCNST